MIDATTGYEAMSFMDGSSSYNQIRMAPKDEEFTAFRTPKGIYYYKVMPFGLKNAGATYQGAMQNIFDDLLHKNIECYVDDLVAKLIKRVDHLKDLRMVFELLRRYQLRMNPLKCTFRVTSGKFLGFIVRHRGIEIDQARVDAISKMPDPQNIHELKTMPLKVSNKPPVLATPIPGKPLILYIAAQESCDLALVFSIQKMKHYFRAHVVHLISRANPIKFVMSKPVLSDRLARWYLQFQQFEIVYILQKVVKGQALADFLVDHPIPDDWELIDDLPDEDAMSNEIQPPWKMYFNGAAHRGRAGADIVFITSQEEIYEVKKPKLRHYHDYAQRLIGWLRDVTLQHVRRTENKKTDALASLASTLTLSDQMQVTICQRWIVPPPNEEEYIENELEHLVAISEAVKEDWRQPIIDYMCYGILLENLRRRTHIRRSAPPFFYYKDTLYKRSFEGILLRCLGEEEPIQALQEAHSGVCGSHQSGPKLHFHIKRMGYYWPTMVKDCLEYARTCGACQFHANFIHQPPEVLHPTIASWPFDAWGLDVVGPLPKYSGGHLYILAATDCFSKWVEVVALKEVKKENVANFI
ncbi:uncharacterized protein [Solanum tuberosum]|uniref:uncharacterized protein n=1 Tax=Solanum tuberosum TaxID=4113 RepID=UPI00073A27D0|nr:PREDICTED: uncharacterized protein LOC107058141 [Solanum tuberosum]